MRTVLHAEWTKLRTIAGPAWLLAGAAVLTAGLSTLVVASMRCPATTVVLASSAQLICAGITFRFAIAVLESSVGTLATSDQLLVVEPDVC